MIESLSPKEAREKIKNSIKLGLSAQEVEELAALLRKHKSSDNVFKRSQCDVEKAGA